MTPISRGDLVGAGRLARPMTKIKTRKIIGGAPRLAACRSTRTKPARVAERHKRNVPPRIPDGALELIRDIAVKIRTRTEDGKWKVNGNEVQRILRARYSLGISIHPILNELKEAGYTYEKPGRPAGSYKVDLRLQKRILAFHEQNLSLREIGEKVGLSHEQVRTILQRCRPAEDTK